MGVRAIFFLLLFSPLRQLWEHFLSRCRWRTQADFFPHRWLIAKIRGCFRLSRKIVSGKFGPEKLQQLANLLLKPVEFRGYSHCACCATCYCCTVFTKFIVTKIISRCGV